MAREDLSWPDRVDGLRVLKPIVQSLEREQLPADRPLPWRVWGAPGSIGTYLTEY